MVFKLVRTDCEEPRKIQLPIGTHLIGRGKLLDCDDKRVSRNHGQLEVTDDSIVIKALHQNPCFYTKKGTSETQILKHNLTLELSHGDKFGLLPNAFWFEVLHCTLLDANASPEQTNDGGNTVQSNAETQIAEANGIDDNVTQLQNGVTNGIIERSLSDATDIQEGREDNQTDAFGDDDELINLPDLNGSLGNIRAESLINLPDLNGSLGNIRGESLINLPDLNGSLGNIRGESLINLPDLNGSLGNIRAESPSMIPTDASHSVAEANVDVAQPPTPHHLHQPAASTSSPSKRCHSDSPQQDDVTKKVKTEPVDVKQEPEDVKPGPSQLGVQNPDPAAGGSDPNAPPAAPAARERCWYGASCYRKNPQHKVQFSHPTDSDWGSAPRVPCPYGRDCRKPDPRHWRDHDHPPEAHQPPAPGVHRPAKRRAPQKRKKVPEDEDEESGLSGQDSPVEDLIVTGKRQRKPVKRPTYDGLDPESENEDPYATDESDDWNPDGSVKASQDSSFDTQDL